MLTIPFNLEDPYVAHIPHIYPVTPLNGLFATSCVSILALLIRIVPVMRRVYPVQPGLTKRMRN